MVRTNFIHKNVYLLKHTVLPIFLTIAKEFRNIILPKLQLYESWFEKTKKK